MPQYVAIIKSSSAEGVSCVLPSSEDRSWGIVLKCECCSHVTPDPVEVDPSETVSISGGTANMHVKCKECGNMITATMVTGATATKLIKSVPKKDQRLDGKGIPVAVFDVRTAEPISVFMDDQWNAYGVSKDEDDQEQKGTKFENVDLSGDWTDYDEATEVATSIENAEVVFIRDNKLAAYFKS